jgi:PAS domain-containing protein
MTESFARMSSPGSATRFEMPAKGRSNPALRHLLSSPELALPASLCLIALIGAADYVTGYEIRLAILYLLPIALATWVCGRRWGFAMALLGPAIWVASFAKQHPYTSDVYFFWENAVMGVTFIVVVELLARLQDSRSRLERQITTLLDAMPMGAYVTDHGGRIRYANKHLKRQLGSVSTYFEASEIVAAFEPIVPLTAESATALSRELRSGEVRSVHDGRRYRCHCENLSGVDEPGLVLVTLTEIGR